MLPVFTDYLEVFGSDERFLVFATSSVVIATSLFFFVSGSCRATRLLFASAAFLLVFAFVVVAPLNAIEVAKGSEQMNPVSLNFNFGFLALGLGLFLKFRKMPTESVTDKD